MSLITLLSVPQLFSLSFLLRIEENDLESKESITGKICETFVIYAAIDEKDHTNFIELTSTFCIFDSGRLLCENSESFFVKQFRQLLSYLQIQVNSSTV